MNMAALGALSGQLTLYYTGSRTVLKSIRWALRPGAVAVVLKCGAGQEARSLCPMYHICIYTYMYLLVHIQFSDSTRRW